MERAEGLKLYLIGALSVLALVASGLVNAAVIPVDNRVSQGTQYLIVGILLGLIFGFFGGFEDLVSRIRSLRMPIWRRRSTVTVPTDQGSRLMVFGRFQPETEISAPGPGDSATTGSRETNESVLPVPRSGTDVSPRPSAEATERAATAVIARPAAEVVAQPSTSADVVETVARHEAAMVDRLISDGVLTGDGPITDEDVGVMVVASVISAELSERLLGLIDPPPDGGALDRPAELAERSIPALDYRPPERSG